jgi:hypothetical protein
MTVLEYQHTISLVEDILENVAAPLVESDAWLSTFFDNEGVVGEEC